MRTFEGPVKKLWIRHYSFFIKAVCLFAIKLLVLDNVYRQAWASVVEHTARNQGIVGLYPAECWAFFLLLSFLLSYTSEVSLIRSFKQEHLQCYVAKAIQMNA